MKGRYEIRRRLNADDYATNHGMRFTALDRAQRELEHSVPRRDWDIWDRQEGTWT